MSALRREISLLEDRLANDRPTLGICLGSQLIARALGARVFAGPIKEIGWGRVTLTSQGRASCLAPLADDGAAVLHWHSDTFDLPQGVRLLASSTCYDNQAFSHGSSTLALQFPPRGRCALAGASISPLGVITGGSRATNPRQMARRPKSNPAMDISATERA